jgi:hypothetical protein
MKKKLEYSFDDEVVSKFCFDMDNKKIEVHFTGYFDLMKDEYFDKPCVLVIESWLDAKSKFHSGIKYDRLEMHLGIFSMILSLDIKGEDLEITVNTLDNRYINLIFIKPLITLKK